MHKNYRGEWSAALRNAAVQRRLCRQDREEAQDRQRCTGRESSTTSSRESCANMLAVCKGAMYVCMSSSELHTLYQAFTDTDGHWSTFVIWAKHHFTLSGKAVLEGQSTEELDGLLALGFRFASGEQLHRGRAQPERNSSGRRRADSQAQPPVGTVRVNRISNSFEQCTGKRRKRKVEAVAS
jgi:hypothetical protein